MLDLNIFGYHLNAFYKRSGSKLLIFFKGTESMKGENCKEVQEMPA
jgi:hypothetical protein